MFIYTSYTKIFKDGNIKNMENYSITLKLNYEFIKRQTILLLVPQEELA